MTAPHSYDPAADITRLLAAWSYTPNLINARKVSAEDGRTILQMRLELGLLQMEVTGRPDGLRPHGCESLFDYFQGELARFVREHGTDNGFIVPVDQCRSLREEAGMYYHRYLASYVLGDFPRVVADTARNLCLLDFFPKYAAEEKEVLEQYRPYILMMHARGQAAVLLAEGRRAEARSAVEDALAVIHSFFATRGGTGAFDAASEVIVLRQLLKDLDGTL